MKAYSDKRRHTSIEHQSERSHPSRTRMKEQPNIPLLPSFDSCYWHQRKYDNSKKERENKNQKLLKNGNRQVVTRDNFDDEDAFDSETERQRTRFSVGRTHTEYRVKGPIGRKQKSECLFKCQEKTNSMQTAYFTTKLNIPISHYGEMIKFLKFQSKLLFLAFVVE